jgi:hypothetical protein
MCGQTDKQTDMADLKYVPLKLIIEIVLRIMTALANYPVVPEVTTLSQLTLTLEKQGKACGKEAEIDHSSHSHCTPCPNQPLTISAQNEHQKPSNTKDHSVAVNVSVHKLSSYFP